MNQQSENKIKLGFFVLAALVLFIVALYYIGSKKNIFHSTVTVSAYFNNVNGLLPGNNVRFNGINVGTVSKVEAVSDTVIRVAFTVDKELTKFISQNSILSIGSDGLLGNKLVNITPGEKGGEPVTEGSTFNALHSLQMEEAMRTLNKTNANVEKITDDLKTITQKINNSHSLWNLLSDSVAAEQLKATIVNIQTTSNRSAIITGDLRNITNDLRHGRGSLGALITDTSIYSTLRQAVIKFDKISDTIALVSGNLYYITKQIRDGKGSAGMLLNDTNLIHNLNKSMENIKAGSQGFNENMEGLKHSALLKQYFKKQGQIKKKQ